jgi:hypothetical protein
MTHAHLDGPTPTPSRPRHSPMVHGAALLLVLLSSHLPAQEYASFFLRMKPVRRIALFEPDMRVFETSTGGVWEYRVDWSKTCRNLVAAVVCSTFQSMGYVMQEFRDEKNDPPVTEIERLMKLVSERMAVRMEGERVFPDQERMPDFAVGPVTSLCDRLGVDALMFVGGFDEVYSPGRRKLVETHFKFFTMRWIIFGILTMTPVRTYIGRERAALRFMIVNADGTVVYFKNNSGASDQDFRDHAMLGYTVETMVTDLPRVDH